MKMTKALLGLLPVYGYPLMAADYDVERRTPQCSSRWVTWASPSWWVASTLQRHLQHG